MSHFEKGRPNSIYHYVGHGVDLRQYQAMKHHSGRIYSIKWFSNTSVDETKQHRHMVTYMNVRNGTIWTRPIKDIKEKFEIEEIH